MNHTPDITPEDLEEIERYLAREMSAGQQEAFEIRIASDPQLRNQTNELRIIAIGIREHELRLKLDTFHGQTGENMATHPGVIKRLEWRKWLSVAAMLFALSTAAWWVWLRPTLEDKVFATYYQPDPGLMTTMGGNDDYQFNRAMIDYKTGNYDSAISRWTTLKTNVSAGDTLNYFLAAAYLAKKDYVSALPLFEQVTGVTNSVFISEAYWYAALTALRLKKKELAVQYFRKSDREEKQQVLSELE